jgi:cytochrome P450
MRAVFYFLLKSPDNYKRVQKEIDDAFSAGSLSTPPKYSESIQLPFMCACIKEAFRMHPSVALTMPRHSPKAGMVVADTFIPAGYRVGVNAAVIHFDKGIFGNDADRFNPARWLEGDHKRMDKYMVHFGGGTRTCIGKNVSHPTASPALCTKLMGRFP